jgi:hypothetical protein
MTDDAVFTGGTVEVAGGKLKVRSGSITSNELASSSVVTAKIVNEAVITEKISDSAITTIKLANSTDSTTGVTTAKIADSNVTTAKLADASVVAGKLSGAQTGSAPIYGCRAWVNFDGITEANIGGTYVRSSTTVTVTTSVAHGLIVGHKVYLNFTSGTAADGAFVVTGITSSTIFTVTHGTSGATSGSVTLNRRLIRGSGNVANVSALGVGQYAVNFTTAFPNANYARAGFVNFVNTKVAAFVGGNSATTTTAQSCDIFVGNSTTGDELNVSLVNVMFIG